MSLISVQQLQEINVIKEIFSVILESNLDLSLESLCTQTCLLFKIKITASEKSDVIVSNYRLSNFKFATKYILAQGTFRAFMVNCLNLILFAVSILGVRTMAKAYANTPTNHQKESLTNVKCGYKECTQVCI